ncbi:hypothetical protein PspLS_06406 [Pyricularia sp. CBS 133598]|nr:hypothetical protein PspLS_06406 [Pyricularia sp. CBS 133598]
MDNTSAGALTLEHLLKDGAETIIGAVKTSRSIPNGLTLVRDAGVVHEDVEIAKSGLNVDE